VMAGLSGTHEVALIDTSYYGEVTSINPQSSAGDRDIVISGRAIERATGLPLSGVPLDLVISVSGFDRTNKIFTESDGTFTYTFTPMAGEAGVYTVGAVHPDLLDRPVQGQFVISRVSVSPTTINLSIPWNYERTMTVRVETTEGTQATNLRIEYRAEDQTGGAFPAGIHLTPGAPIASLGSRQSGNLSFSLWADTDATEIGKVVLKVRSDESGEGAWGTVVVNTHFSQAVPVLSFTPDHVETGVAHDDTVFETVVLENKGLAALDGVALALVSADGTPAPSWVRLNSAATLGAIAVGEKREVTLSFSPTAALAAEGSYSFKLKVTAANYPETPINIYCMVTQSGIGSALFKVTDIYTGSVASGGGVVQGLAGAKITLQNEVNLTITSNQTTDSFGESMFRDLPAGTYKFRVTAADHQERIGRLWIKPGVTTSQEVFLDYNLVTVEWEVKETTIQDKYDIVLTTTYKTDVPAAVVVAQPASVTLPAMKTGDVYNGEFTLTNYGLIRAEKVTFTLPTDDPHFRYELLGGLPTTIEAKQRITVPYRVTCVQSPTQQGEGTGGGCERSMRCIVTGYQYVCINGVWTLAATNYCFTYDNGQCTGGTGSAGGGGIPPLPPSGGGTGYYGGPGTGGGTVSASPAPAPKPIAGVKCFPQCKRKECDQCCPKENEQDCCEPVLSRVRLTFREYNLDEADLAVKVPGGAISVGRRFYGDAWHFEHERHNFTMKREMFVVMGAGGGTAAGSVLSIDKGGVEYERESTSPLVLVNDTYRITQTGPDTAPTGYRWEDKNGSWKEYETTGETSARVTSYGTANGVVGKVLYEPGENGRALGISDRNDRQVIWFEYGPDGKLSAARDLTNRRVEYGYTEGRLSSVKDVLSHETLYDYDTKGRITKVTHPVSSGEGRVATVAYDDYGGVSSVLDNNGNGWFFDYDYDQGKNEFYARIRTSAGKVKEIWYDKDYETKRIDVNGRTIKRIVKDGRSLAITDENGNVSRKDYDEWENLTRVINPDGSEVTNEYEHAHNRLAKSTNERGVVTRYTYDGAGNLLRKTEAEGTPSERVTEYTYDSDGNRLSTKVLGDASTAEALTAMTYDANGNMATLTDAEGNVTRFTTHDVMGNVLTKEDARGKVWTYGYDDAGRPTSVRDPLTNLTEIFYDELGNKQREVDAEGKETKYEYDVRGNMTKRTDALGNSTLFTYNPDGKLVKQTDAEGKEVRYEYDLDGRLKKTIDGNGNETSLEYESGLGSSCSACSGAAKEQPSRITYPTFVRDFRYDSRGRKVEELDILSATEKYTTTFSYDSAGNLISKKDKEEKTTSYEYDELNRLKRVIDPLSQGTEYTYDDRNNLIALKDAKEQVTRFQYDRNNRLVREIRPLGQETSYEYDPAGNLERKVDAKNQKIEYGYDDAGRLTETRYYTAFGDTTPVKTITLTHDKVGNLKTYNDGTTSGAYGYDDVHRKTSESVDYGSFSLAYAYDYYKNGMKKSFTGPDGAAYQYTYDDANQLASVAIPNQGSITFSSYLWNRPTAVVLPGGSRREYSYDPLMRTQTITVKDPLQNAIMGYTYAYDKMDNIKGKATEHGPYAYDYDELYRLKTADNPTISDEAFTYDAVGNRVTSAGVTGSWNYNANNELSEYDGVSFEYDANGNTTRKTGDGTVTVFAYDVDNRMVRVEDGSGSVIATYYYDPFGRRLWKEVGGTRTNFVHADEGLVGEYDAAGAEIKTYGYRPDSTWTTDPLFMKQAGEYFFYQNDHLGTPQKITNVNGSVVWSAKYESFGMAQVEAGSTVENNLRFPGQYYDTETGLCYNWHRYYDPRVGRYLTEDPKGFEDGLNFYLYGRNNPILNMDPFGLFGLSSCADEAIGKCGRPIICFAKAIYLPICGIVCGLLIRNPWVCIIGCPLYTAYKIVKCINELQDCLDKNMKECCSKPGSEYDYSCDCYVQKQNK
jgi:RHS repeat-associated protein